MTAQSNEELLKSIEAKAREVWKHKDDPETLSKLLVDLSVLNWGLGQWLSDADDAERTLKTELDYQRAKIIKTLTGAGDSIAKAEVEATLNLQDKRKEYNEVKHGLELYKLRRKDTEKIMDALRSRLSLIKQDIRNEQ